MENKSQEDDILKRISQGDDGTEASINSRNEEIANELRRRIRTAQKDVGVVETDGEDLRYIDNAVAYKFAKETNTWIGNLYSLGKTFIGGNENTCVVNENEKVVYKSNNLSSTISINNFFDKIRLHNFYFHDTIYRFEGFTGIGDTGSCKPYVEPVYSQNFVMDAEYSTPKEISEYMKNLGFEQLSASRFKKTDIEVWDLLPRNVLKDKNGDIYVVDAEFIEHKNSIFEYSIGGL